MGAPKIQADYSSLEQISANFSKESDQTRQLLQTVKSCVDALKGGGWIGKGANAYFNEQESMVFPEMQRLQNALAMASRSTRQISKIFQDAAQEAAGMLSF